HRVAAHVKQWPVRSFTVDLRKISQSWSAGDTTFTCGYAMLDAEALRSVRKYWPFSEDESAAEFLLAGSAAEQQGAGLELLEMTLSSCLSPFEDMRVLLETLIPHIDYETVLDQDVRR